jgi:DNA-binding transcriptional regulator LsrR (DeoR family)
MTNHKTALTFEEKIKVAYLHYVRGVDQQDLATAFEVNSGRINEACKVIKDALNPPEQNE